MRVGDRTLDDPEILREFVRNLREGIYISSTSGRILDANPAFLEMIGVGSIDELDSVPAQALVAHPEQRQRELELLERDGTVREFELLIRRVDGELRTVLDTTYVFSDPITGERRYHGILVDITARKQLESQLIELSIRDPLTGCYNRRYLAEAQKRMLTHPNEHWGCIFMDIDHFKQYNDRHGHQSGDDVLVKMSRFLMRQVRAEEAVVRIGGDEFVILLRGDQGSYTESVAKRLQVAALRTAPVPFSLGWAVREPGEVLERMLGRADANLLEVRVIERAPRSAADEPVVLPED
ncbi:MAG TPA: sensor domain-containing diguanylate cyclase [Vicinamibacterales bacterium]|nr:sensor domain-containing diguanylate cyclase [Vicinamibacterales bacterium]